MNNEFLLKVVNYVADHFGNLPDNSKPGFENFTNDEFEYAYQMKEISFEIYKARERAIEKLEDELELAEEALENKYGIDD